MKQPTNKERAQTWADDYAARSKTFVACMFLGVGKYDKRKADSLEGARQHATDMLSEYDGVNYKRGVLIYAVTPDNLSVHVDTVNP